MPNPKDYMDDEHRFTRAYVSLKRKSDKNDENNDNGCCLLMVIAIVVAMIAAYLFGHQLWLHGWGIH